MLFGKSVFQSVLDRMGSDDQPDDAAPVASYRVAGLTTGFVVDGASHEAPVVARVETAYLDFLADEAMGEAAKPDEPPRMPEHLKRLTPAEIALDLGLSDADTPLTLAEKRRAFARSNHPDGTAEAFRENATIRMTIANQLIDEAIHRIARRR